MSMDTVDDLQAAEDELGLHATALAEVLTARPWRRRAARRRWRWLLTRQQCRPTCGFLDDPDREDETCEMYEDGTPACGCPCNHERPTP